MTTPKILARAAVVAALLLGAAGCYNGAVLARTAFPGGEPVTPELSRAAATDGIAIIGIRLEGFDNDPSVLNGHEITFSSIDIKTGQTDGRIYSKINLCDPPAKGESSLQFCRSGPLNYYAFKIKAADLAFSSVILRTEDKYYRITQSRGDMLGGGRTGYLVNPHFRDYGNILLPQTLVFSVSPGEIVFLGELTLARRSEGRVSSPAHRFDRAAAAPFIASLGLAPDAVKDRPLIPYRLWSQGVRELPKPQAPTPATPPAASGRGQPPVKRS